MTVPQLLFPAGTRVVVSDREARLTCSLRSGAVGRVDMVRRFGVRVTFGRGTFWFAPSELSVAS